MSAAGELIRRLARHEEVPLDLLGEVDVVELGEIIERLLRWPVVPDAAEVLGAAPLSIAGRAPRVRVIVASMPPAIFARLVATQDPRAVDFAATVDPLALGFLAVRAMAIPPRDDVIAILDSMIIADRERVLGEQW